MVYTLIILQCRVIFKNNALYQKPTFSSASRRSSMSTGLGPMEPDEGRERRKDVRPDVGFRSRESLQVLAYLRTIQNYQLRLLCLRVRKPLLFLWRGRVHVSGRDACPCILLTGNVWWCVSICLCAFVGHEGNGGTVFLPVGGLREIDLFKL